MEYISRVLVAYWLDIGNRSNTITVNLYLNHRKANSACSDWVSLVNDLFEAVLFPNKYTLPEMWM